MDRATRGGYVTSYRHTGEVDEVLAEDVHQLPRPDLVRSGAGNSEQPRLVVDHGKRLRCLRPIVPEKGAVHHREHHNVIVRQGWLVAAQIGTVQENGSRGETWPTELPDRLYILGGGTRGHRDTSRRDSSGNSNEGRRVCISPVEHFPVEPGIHPLTRPARRE